MQSFSETAALEQAQRDGITHISTGVAVLRDQKILLVRRAPADYLGGYFELPGGGVDAGEGIAAAALREVEEETGLKSIKILTTFAGFDYATDQKPRVRQINFLVTAWPGKVVLSAEHDECAWVDETDLDALKMTDGMRTCVKNALAAVGSARLSG